MKKLSIFKWLAVSTLVVTTTLAACGNDRNTSSKPGHEGNPKEQKTIQREDGIYSVDDFELTKETEGDNLGGTLKVGIVASSAFEGTLDFQFYGISTDADIIEWFNESLFYTDEDFQVTEEGPATIEASEDKKTYTVTIKENVNWHDGEPVKAEDFVFAHEVIGHKDYDGPRYDASFQNIVGMAEYHSGEADEISGFEIIDDKTVRLTFKEATPSLMNGGIWFYAMAKHYFEGVEIADMSASDQVRVKPIGYGPFKVESIEPGESVTLVKNEDYWRGEPKVDRVVLKVVNPDVVAQALRSGEIDMVNTFPSSQFADNADMNNVDWLGRVALSYSYIGFNLGTWNAEEGQINTDPDAKMADVSLRKAVRLAVNYEELGEKMYSGLRFPATTVLPPAYRLFHDESNPGFSYDPEKAKQILADAGYEDKDGDGFVETPEGEPLEIMFAARQGDATAEAVANYEMQAWRDIGLNVQLLDGALMEVNAFYDRIQEDDPAIDMYTAGWNVGSDVDPSGLFGAEAQFNFPRYIDDRIEELITEGLSDKAFNLDYRREVYNKFQAYINEVLPLAPTLYSLDVEPINKRVSGYSIERGNNDYGYHTIQLNAEEPVVN
ncbi:oligopeptide ABC transporter substrate-binding protein [Shouchella lonarensis]|uniref:Peptide/nickel transport system substrate-binding protein n=1 Tax=Shouchella lonarensis TaxID=1464122 RepID=A0A1G6H0U7_9BACI|nr:oligopeptide ABC transporter substrate-binding protein [Shouchella lonarensis]SDB87892.1 peptide/nickel transport system substrate-binding protein [Shouchella lonarensis]